MRIVVLSSSVYSETACAVASGLAGITNVVAGVLSLRTLDYQTLLRKLGQWGAREVAQYAWMKITPRGRNKRPQLHNPYLAPYLDRAGRRASNLRQLATIHGFSVATCKNHNSRQAIAQLRRWSPDLIVFAGGSILREPVLRIPRLGVINLHLGLLPHVRGMASPEWSLLTGVPVGITIHYIDTGIDTGRVLLRREFAHVADCASLADLRNRLVAFGVRQIMDVVCNLQRGSILPQNQPLLEADSQFFVMHDRLRAIAARRLAGVHSSPGAHVA